MAIPQDPKTTASPRRRLRLWVDTWDDLLQETRFLKDKIERLSEGTGSVTNAAEIGRLQERLRDAARQRNNARDEVIDIVTNRPKLKDEAIEWGFNEKVLTEALEGPYGGSTDPDKAKAETSGKGDAVETVAQEDEGFTPSGGPGGGGGGGGGQNNLAGMAADNRLLGDLGKSFTLVRGPKGTYVAKYRFKIDGQVIDIGIRLGKAGELERYGLKASDAKEITKAQMKQIRRIGNADELAPFMRKGDDDVFDSLVRYLENQYEGQPILRNKGVMAKIIANSMFGWSAGEFENQLRNTKWYQSTNDWQRNWQTVTSDKEKKDIVASYRQQVVNALESHYGFDYLKFVDGGIETINRWADQISSGRWGTPDEGFKFWSERQFDKAAKTEGTPAWIENQKQAEAAAAFLNRPEDMFESLRSQAMDYLGQAKGKPLVPRETLKQWATDLVTGDKSQGDWQQFLRQQARNLHPYFDENQSYTSQAGAYKSTAESLIGTTLTWDDPLLKRIAATDDEGKLLGTPLALHDFEQYIRDNDDRFWDNPDTENQSLGFISEFLARTSGVR